MCTLCSCACPRKKTARRITLPACLWKGCLHMRQSCKCCLVLAKSPRYTDVTRFDVLLCNCITLFSVAKRPAEVAALAKQYRQNRKHKSANTYKFAFFCCQKTLKRTIPLEGAPPNTYTTPTPPTMLSLIRHVYIGIRFGLSAPERGKASQISVLI